MRVRRFLLLFIALYGVFHVAYVLVPDRLLLGVIYPRGVGEPSALLINAISPTAQAVAQHNAVVSPRAHLAIVRGCDGSGALFIVLAATLALGAPIRRTLLGVLAGAFLVYAVNQLRVVGLFFVITHRMDWFPLLHVYVAPISIILFVSCFFLFWSRWALALAEE